MLVMNLVDELIASVNAAVVTQGSKWDGAYVLELLPQIKAEAQSISYNGSRAKGRNASVHPMWLMIYDATIIGNQQDSSWEYVVAQIPNFIRINENTDGLVYCGGANIAVNFHRQQTVSEISDLKNRGFLKGKEICYVVIGSETRFYGNKALKSFQAHIVPASPFDIPTYKPLQHDYPVDPDTIAIMKDLFIQRAMREAGMVTDKVLTGEPTNEQGALKSNIASK